MTRLALAALSLCACQAKLASVTISDSSQVVVERGTLVEEIVGDIGFGDFLNMDITQDTELQNQGVEPGDIREVTLTSFELEALEPTGADLSFIESMELRVSAPDLDEVVIAHQDSFPAGQPRVAFDLEDVDLTDYAVSQSMTFTTAVEGHRPDDDTTVEARYDVKVGFTAQGAVGQL